MDMTDKTILLVDDEVILALTQKNALENCGYAVTVVNSGEEALALIESAAKIDLILMDIDLGTGMNGIQAAETILASREIPLLFLSSHTEPHIIQKIGRIPSYGFLIKESPITVLDTSIRMAFKLFDANRKTKELKDKLQSTLDALPDILFELDGRGIYYDIHSPHADLLYLPAESRIGKCIYDCIPAETAAVIMESVREAERFGRSTGKEYSLAVPAGLRHFDISTARLEMERGEPHFITLCRDISDWKAADERLRKSEIILRSFVDNAPFNIWARDLDSVGILENQKSVDQIGSILGKTPEKADENGPEIIALWKNNNARALSGEVIHENCEYEKNGRPFIFEQIIFPLYYKDTIYGIAGFDIDITSRMKEEEIIREIPKNLALREFETLSVLGRAAEHRDPETANHIIRVAHASKLVAAALGLDTDRQELIFHAAPLHDVGKLGVPDSLLLKEGRLTEAEFRLMKNHTTIGYNILKSSSGIYLQTGAEIALTHHEKFAGDGYPAGLAGEAIPLFGRIVALTDAYDAMITKRPYKDKWEVDKVTGIIRQEKGRHFDPEIADVFLANIDRITLLYEEFRD